MLTDEDILQRYVTKQADFDKEAQISLVGHSLFDMWSDQPEGTPKLLAGKTVANFGISGVSARQYLDVIVKPKRINHLGDDVFLFLGVNDIVKEPDYSPAQVMAWLQEIVQGLQQVNPNARYYLLEATPVNNIATTDNPAINEMNTYLKAHTPKEWQFVETQTFFRNEEGKLDPKFCVDGLHFSAEGYQVLTRILENALAK